MSNLHQTFAEQALTGAKPVLVGNQKIDWEHLIRSVPREVLSQVRVAPDNRFYCTLPAAEQLPYVRYLEEPDAVNNDPLARSPRTNSIFDGHWTAFEESSEFVFDPLSGKVIDAAPRPPDEQRESLSSMFDETSGLWNALSEGDEESQETSNCESFPTHLPSFETGFSPEPTIAIVDSSTSVRSAKKPPFWVVRPEGEEESASASRLSQVETKELCLMERQGLSTMSFVSGSYQQCNSKFLSKSLERDFSPLPGRAPIARRCEQETRKCQREHLRQQQRLWWNARNAWILNLPSTSFDPDPQTRDLVTVAFTLYVCIIVFLLCFCWSLT